LQKKNSSDELFDHHASTYDDDLAKGLALTGESKSYFAETRVEWLKKKLSKMDFTTKNILDYGCGDGATVPLLADRLSGELMVGTDPSAKAIAIAKQKYAGDNFEFHILNSTGLEHSIFDLVYSNGVFHHITVEQRPETIKWIHDRLHIGGVFALWENNPLNPATRLIMSRVAFDRGCVMVWPHQARKMLIEAGFNVISISYQFIFPRFLGLFRFLESPLASIPLGGQYLILAQKK